MKSLKLFVLLSSFAIAITMSGCGGGGYGGYSPSQTLFFDDFNFIANDWSVGSFNNGCRFSSIGGGSFNIRSFCAGENPLFWTNMVYIDQSRNFEIETTIQYVSGEDNNALSLCWGMESNSFFRFRFGISGNGQFIIDRYSGNWYNFQYWIPSSAVNRFSPNKLTVRKIGNTYYFYLNEVLVHSAPFQPFYGQRVGFQCNQNTEMRVGYLRVSYL